MCCKGLICLCVEEMCESPYSELVSRLWLTVTVRRLRTSLLFWSVKLKKMERRHGGITPPPTHTHTHTYTHTKPLTNDTRANNTSKFNSYLTRNIMPLHYKDRSFSPLNAELNPICYLLALLGAHHFLHVSRIRVKSLTLRLPMS